MALDPGGGNSPPAIRHFKKYKKFMQIATPIKTIYCTGFTLIFCLKYLCNFMPKLSLYCDIMQSPVKCCFLFYTQIYIPYLYGLFLLYLCKSVE